MHGIVGPFLQPTRIRSESGKMKAMGYCRARRQTTRLLLASLGICLALSAPAFGQSLDESLASAYTSNPTLRAARAQLRAVNEGVPQALSNWRPAVTVSGSVGRERVESKSSLSESNDTLTPAEVTATVSQPLYRGGRTVAGTERAENEVLAQRATVDSIEQSVLLRAATAYMDVWRDQSVLDLNTNNERVLQRQLEASQDRFNVGELTRTDVAQSETRLATATAGRIAAEGALSTSRAVFEEVVGIAPGTLVQPAPLTDLPGGLEETVQAAIADNPNVLAASFTEKAAQMRVREVIGELYPVVSLNASLRHTEETSLRGSESDSAEILAEVTVPLYQQGAVSSRVREAKQISSQRRVQIEEARRRQEQEAVSGWRALETARAQTRSFESGVRSAEIALEGVRQENSVGARTVLDILDAEQELLDSKVNLVRAQRDSVVAGFQVLSATGRLLARSRSLGVDVYDPDVDYQKVRDSWFGLEAPGAE
jgi:TolC family type I secretion outer membrane protein